MGKFPAWDLPAKNRLEVAVIPRNIVRGANGCYMTEKLLKRQTNQPKTTTKQQGCKINLSCKRKIQDDANPEKSSIEKERNKA